MVDNEDDDDDENCLGAIGFMFDAQHARCTKHLHFDENIHLEIRLIGEDPGHVQSGQYLWPAAAFTAKYLIQHWNALQATTIIELGAGVGVAGLVASKLPGCRKVVLTDYDPGAIQLLEENMALNGVIGNDHHDDNDGRKSSTNDNSMLSEQEVTSSSSAIPREESANSCSASCVGACNVSVSFLRWGSDISDLYGLLGIDCRVVNPASSSNESNVSMNGHVTSSSSDCHEKVFHDDFITLPPSPPIILSSNECLFSLVLGTDLLYSIDIVSPLFKSAKMLMAQNGRFLLISSFFPGQVCYSSSVHT